MPGNALHEDSFFFIQAGKLCSKSPVTCSPHTSVIELARLMQQHNISGVIVADHDTPHGIVTLRDLRNLVANAPETLLEKTVADIMHPGLITIQENDYLFNAIFTMAKHKIHRLVVTDCEGKITGLLTNTDLLRVQTRCPLYMSQEIETCESFEQLRTVSNRMTEMLEYAINTGADSHSLISLIAHFNDVLTMHAITLMDSLEGIRLPEGAAFLMLGSDGRGEQTLRTDQDSALVYADNLPPERIPELQRFSARLVDALEYLGVPRCPGNTMAINPQWFHSLSEWKTILNQWINTPTPDNMVNFGMFQDMRAIHGDVSLQQSLHEHIIAVSHQTELFFPYMARNIVRFKPPLGLFGQIKTDSERDNNGSCDLKKSGIFTLTLGVSLLALDRGFMGGNTWEKIDRLRNQGAFTEADLDIVEHAFSYLLHLRLRSQLKAVKEGLVPDNRIYPEQLSERERDLLKQAFKGVNQIIQMLKSQFKLDLIRS